MYPSIITTFPQVSPTDRLNSPSHSALHNSVSSVLTQVETFVGREGSTSTLGTLVYDIRSPLSNGGGHVQTANKGGTGQTTYTKGDILVATSSSVLTKVAVGGDGQVLVANSSTASGVNWGAGGETTKVKVAVSGSVVTYSGAGLNAAENVIMSATIPGSTLGTNNALKARIHIGYAQDNAGSSLVTRFKYGTSVVATVNTVNMRADTSVMGVMEFDLIAANNSNQQRGAGITNLIRTTGPSSAMGIQGYNSSIIGVDSNSSQLLEVTVQSNVNSAANIVTSTGFIVEKIV